MFLLLQFVTNITQAILPSTNVSSLACHFAEGKCVNYSLRLQSRTRKEAHLSLICAVQPHPIQLVSFSSCPAMRKLEAEIYVGVQKLVDGKLLHPDN
jgi:hypothetical protein